MSAPLVEELVPVPDPVESCARFRGLPYLLFLDSARDPEAAPPHGDGWLAYLDKGASRSLFADGEGALLLDGGFRREVDAARADALVARARRRFLEWMAPR